VISGVDRGVMSRVIRVVMRGIQGKERRKEGKRRREEGGRGKEATVQCYVDGNESEVLRVSGMR
jgi:hypothetical protein